MANITLAISEQVHKRMKKHREIRWSEAVRNIIEKKLDQLDKLDGLDEEESLKIMDEILSKSKLTEGDALEIGEKVKRGVSHRHELSSN